MMRRAYIGIGANQGRVTSIFEQAKEALSNMPHTTWIEMSPLYRTRPMEADGPDFLNGVALIETMLDSHTLLNNLLTMEKELGCARIPSPDFPHPRREIDLDLLIHGRFIVRSLLLTLPHPSIQNRLFVLRPLADLDPDLYLPGYGRIEEIIKKLPEQEAMVSPFDGQLWDGL